MLRSALPAIAITIITYLCGDGHQLTTDAFTTVPRIASIERRNVHVVHSSVADEEEDWRAFRAKLIQNGIDKPISSTSDEKYAYVTTPLVEVGSILISIPTTDLCQALDQQYWHRSVVLITEVSDNLINGNIEDAVPDDQLALGDNRGRWAYRGLLLNRFTDLKMFGSDDITITKEECDRDVWNVQQGGDLLGLDSSSGTDFVCLHNKLESSSTKIGNNLYYTSLSKAKELCKQQPTKYHPNDFMTFGGFCAWRPGQLEREMGNGREEWVVISADGGSIWEELNNQQEKCNMLINQESNDNRIGHELLESGTNMWRNFLNMINIPETKATEKLPSGQLKFFDRMLEVWAEGQLGRDKNNNFDKTSLDCDDSSSIGPGTIVRARSPPTRDILLYDAELIRSVILVLEDTSEATVGIILNHPMAAAIDCVDGEDPLTLRYGGAVDAPSWRDGSYRDEVDDGDDDDDVEEVYNYLEDSYDFLTIDNNSEDYDMNNEDIDDSQFIWIHRSANLGFQQGGGKKLGNLNLWLIKEDDALEHLQSGYLGIDDLMVFSGVSIWEKGPELGLLGGGLKEQVDNLGALEIVDTNSESMIESIWDTLTKQNILTKESLESNIDAATKVWGLCSRKSNDLHTLSYNDISRERLSDATLKAWVARNLLEDPMNTLVEVEDDQITT